MADETSEEQIGREASERPATWFEGSDGLEVAVWKFKTNKARDRYSIRLTRSYKDGNGECQSTDYLSDGHLLRAQRLFQLADDWVERDKAKSVERRVQEGPSR